VTSLIDYPLPRVTIPEVTEERRKEHVADDEGGLEGSGLAILNLVFVLDLPENSCQEKKRTILKISSNGFAFLKK